MTTHLRELRGQEKQRIILERDITLAHEAQQYLYPRSAPVLSGAKVWGMTAPARIVSGDLYDFFPFGDNAVGLLCADVSGKGMSAALMMAHLQAVAHGRTLAVDQPSARPSPSAARSMLLKLKHLESTLFVFFSVLAQDTLRFHRGGPFVCQECFWFREYFPRSGVVGVVQHVI